MAESSTDNNVNDLAVSMAEHSEGSPVENRKAGYKQAEHVHKVVTPIIDLVVSTCFNRTKTLMSSDDERERERVDKPEFKLELIEECIHTICDKYDVPDDRRPKPMGVSAADIKAMEESIAALQKQIDEEKEMRELKRKPKSQPQPKEES
ncbi:hypothetical protein FOL47_005570 [Perkinsus chesapeaki]|uniref:Uncharacterized protein n=1 Tax=Perkinsus chesapeaki TaxID=330153 RepID=A0A7J6LWT2_PERCH|nr:hypothetical protein FOL47_005570 [Perkinsus chesapeaki]